MNYEEPAFPVNFANDTEWPMEDPFGGGIPEHSNTQYTGITKREYFAAKALQGLLANKKEYDAEEFALAAFGMADAMIKESNNEG